jgi:hypothetical protein
MILNFSLDLRLNSKIIEKTTWSETYLKITKDYRVRLQSMGLNQSYIVLITLAKSLSTV